jgi:hypothetical protein
VRYGITDKRASLPLDFRPIQARSKEIAKGNRAVTKHFGQIFLFIHIHSADSEEVEADACFIATGATDHLLHATQEPQITLGLCSGESGTTGQEWRGVSPAAGNQIPAGSRQAHQPITVILDLVNPVCGGRLMAEGSMKAARDMLRFSWPGQMLGAVRAERLGARPAECHGRIVRLQATWRPSFAFGGRIFCALRCVPAPSWLRRHRAAQWRLWQTCCSDAHPLLPVRSTTSSGEGRSSVGLCSPMARRHRSGSRE